MRSFNTLGDAACKIIQYTNLEFEKALHSLKFYVSAIQPSPTTLRCLEGRVDISKLDVGERDARGAS